MPAFKNPVPILVAWQLASKVGSLLKQTIRTDMFGRAESDPFLNANFQATSIDTGFLKAGIQQRKDQLKF